MSANSSNDLQALQERLSFIGIDTQARADLAVVQKSIEQHLGPALGLFYEKLMTVPAVSSFFAEGKPQVDRAQGRQTGHWHNIAAGKFDAEYLESSKKVGLRHARIGLEPRWYIGGYGLIVETLMKGVVADVLNKWVEEQPKGLFAKKPEVAAVSDQLSRSLSAMVKAVMVDIDLAVTVYFDKLTEDAAERDRVATAKVEHAVRTTGEMLNALAEGDLTVRITDAFEPEFQKIKDDSNAVADKFETIVSQLRETSNALRTATGEILSGANDLADRTTKQAATIEETSAAMEQLLNTVTENAQRAEQASARAKAATQLAAEGGAVMLNANGAMERITQSSGKISNIIGMIDDIAFQTNLLALNASVEAARAGEAGKGFAVVAVEVRRLAQNAAQASSDVKVLIEQSGTEVKGGTQLVADATAKLKRIVDAVQENGGLMEQIAAASGSQTSAIGEITVAVRQMDEMTQHNAALVEETNAAIEQTEGQAVALDQIVEVFTITATGNQTQRRRRAA